MRPLTESEQNNWRMIQMIAYVLALAVPIIYVIVAKTVTAPSSPEAGVDMIYYILLILAAFQPAVAPIINRVQVNQYLRSSSRPAPGKFFFSIAITRLALVEAIFTYGLVVFFVSGDFGRMLYFYPLGAAWMFVYWPRKGRYETFIEEVERNVNRP